MIKYSRELLGEKSHPIQNSGCNDICNFYKQEWVFFKATKINKRHLKNNTFFISRVLAKCNSILDFYDLVKMNLSNSDQHSMNAIQA